MRSFDDPSSLTPGERRGENVPPKVAQMLARHPTISLTMDRYTHLGMAIWWMG
jgi:hypothetical protein